MLPVLYPVHGVSCLGWRGIRGWGGWDVGRRVTAGGRRQGRGYPCPVWGRGNHVLVHSVMVPLSSSRGRGRGYTYPGSVQGEGISYPVCGEELPSALVPFGGAPCPRPWLEYPSPWERIWDQSPWTTDQEYTLSLLGTDRHLWKHNLPHYRRFTRMRVFLT